MVFSASRGGAWTGIFTALAVAGCLDPNPSFMPQLPTASDSSDATTTTTDSPVVTTTQALTDATSPTSGDPTSASSETTTSETTSTVDMTTGWQPVCGDGVMEAGEQCDDGVNNDDAGMCTSSCTLASCGDGHVFAPTEHCDDGNTDPDDGCIECQVPRTCKDVQSLAGDVPSAPYQIDPDGPGPLGQLLTYCDMEHEGGGWTVIESSPFGDDAIGYALFKDHPVNGMDPSNSRFRMPKPAILAMFELTQDAYIGCGSDDYLVTEDANIMLGDSPGAPCGWSIEIPYKKAVLKGVTLTNTSLCTKILGANDEPECHGAWSIDEEQSWCDLPDFPWKDMEALASPGAELFATDTYFVDEMANPNIHGCHNQDSVRVVMLR